MKIPAFLLIGLFAISTAAIAQNSGQDDAADDPKNSKTNDQEVRNGFWEANLPGGNYLVALGRISSVSRHKYVLDGTLIVDEVTVDTTGQALARFYFIEPISGGGGTGEAASQAIGRVVDLVDGAVRRQGTEVQDMVVKKYPLTTHAKAIEYRLLSEAQLSALYKSARTAWVTGKGRVFTGG